MSGMLPAPTPYELVEAVAAILGDTANHGTVEVDPLVASERDFAELARLLMDPITGEVDGWFVWIDSENPPELLGADGFAQEVTIACLALVTVNPARAGATSRQYVGAKVAQAKSAFADPANRRLRFTDKDVREKGLYAPEGYPNDRFGATECHSAPMKLDVWFRGC